MALPILRERVIQFPNNHSGTHFKAGKMSTGGVAPVSMTDDHCSMILYSSTRCGVAIVGLRTPKTKASHEYSMVFPALTSLERDELTQTHDYTVAETLGMVHKLFRRETSISQHLHCFSVLQRKVFLLATCFIEELMHEFALKPPLIVIGPYQDVIPSCNKLIRDV